MEAEAILITYDVHNHGERILVLRGDKLRGYAHSSKRVSWLLYEARKQGGWRARDVFEFTKDDRTLRRVIVRRYE